MASNASGGAVAKGRPRVSEKVEQARGVLLLRTLGAKLYVLGTVRPRGDYHGTCQTAGICDVWAFVPVRGSSRRVLLAWECKAEGGRLRPEQREFRDYCVAAGVCYVSGPCDALILWLTVRGYLTVGGR